MILLQLVLDGVPGTELKTDNINPMLDARAIFVAATRIAKCTHRFRNLAVQSNERD